MIGNVEIIRMNSIRNASLMNAADLLISFSDEELLKALLAIGSGSEY